MGDLYSSLPQIPNCARLPKQAGSAPEFFIIFLNFALRLHSQYHMLVYFQLLNNILVILLFCTITSVFFSFQFSVKSC